MAAPRERGQSLGSSAGHPRPALCLASRGGPSGGAGQARPPVPPRGGAALPGRRRRRGRGECGAADHACQRRPGGFAAVPPRATEPPCPPAGGGAAGPPRLSPSVPGTGDPPAWALPRGDNGATWPPEKAPARRPAGSCGVPLLPQWQREPRSAAGCGRDQASRPSSCPWGQAGIRQSRDSIWARPQGDEPRGCQADAPGAVWGLLALPERPVAPLVPACGESTGQRCFSPGKPLLGWASALPPGTQDALVEPGLAGLCSALVLGQSPRVGEGS